MIIDGYNKAFAITPSDTVDIEQYKSLGLTDAIFVGVGGTIAPMFEDGSSAALTVQASTTIVLPLAVKRIKSTGTAATVLFALYRR